MGFICLLAVLGTVLADSDIIRIPDGVQPVEETYVCTSVPIDGDLEHYITGYDPIERTNAHHIILFGCNEPGSYDTIWDCGEQTVQYEGTEKAPVCQSKPQILYVWAKNAPKLELPEGVGFAVGGATGINHIVMQVHYGHDKNEFDQTAVKVTHTDVPVPRLASTMLLVTAGEIQPYSKESFETVCAIDEDIVIHPFAYRTHTHKHGKEVSGWIVQEDQNGQDHWTLLGRRNPQLPQMFVPIENKTLEVRQGDLLAARCILENDENRVIKLGATDADEMCNFYLMYWTEGGQTLRDNFCLSPGAPNYNWKNQAQLNHIPK